MEKHTFARWSLAALIVLAYCAIAHEPPAAYADQAQDAAALQKIADGPQRSAANKARDRYRHPVQTLTFFGLKPDMTVVEIWPEGGWYTEILAPYLKDQGKLYEALRPGSEAAFKRKMASDPARYSKITTTELMPPEHTEIAPPGSADLVLSFRNVHDWLAKGTAPMYFQAFYRALKPGGILGIVDHRASTKTPYDPKAKSGYVRESEMIDLAKAAGFKYIGSSEINANPKDDTIHPAGVWTLPPTLRLGKQDRAKYEAIGESDRMTLKFIKPATAN
jgi:predicted methyltransferase